MDNILIERERPKTKAKETKQWYKEPATPLHPQENHAEGRPQNEKLKLSQHSFHAAKRNNELIIKHSFHWQWLLKFWWLPSEGRE